MRVNNDSGGAGPLISPVTVPAWRRTVANAYRPDQEEALAGAQHAAMRERFNFALTQCLIGTDSLAAAVTRLIELICKDLDWEWGAFWAFEQDAGALRCKNAWYDDERGLSPFGHHSAALPIAPGQGLVGRVWQTGQAQWVDGTADDPDFLRRERAKECGLLAGYMFPVMYMSADGRQHRPGVLEFFSKLPRQREAQLPGLVASISAFIAQTARRLLTDDLTGLVNRNYFYGLLDEACARIPASTRFGLLYIDLDQFKAINDAFGHAAGNAVLSEFAGRLQALAPVGCAIGRLGGDQFAILAGPEIPLAALNTLAENVRCAARSAFLYEGKELSISTSIGIGIYPIHGASTSALMDAADAAMYLNKRSGRNQASQFSGDSAVRQVQKAAQRSLLSELHHAHLRNEFFLEYQPIFDSAGTRVTALEALIRWRKANGEIVPPDRFIPVAEESGLIAVLGRWVIEQVCRDLPLMQAGGLAGLQVHINMAAPEFLDEELPYSLTHILGGAGIPPSQICLELTEGVVMSRAEKEIPVMHELRRRGFEISLDDFGMGYSSLSLLTKLPISSLKIDRLFVAGVPRDGADCAIVRTILDLGRDMKMRVIAEGVETEAQLGFLREFGCPQIQGFLLGRPMSVARLLAQHGQRPALIDELHTNADDRMLVDATCLA